MEKSKHILIIRLSAMGDVAMTVPVLRELKNVNSSYKISILTNAHYFCFFREFKDLNLIEFNKKQRHKGVIGLIKLYNELSKLEIDYVFDLHNVLRTNFLKLLFKIPFYQIDKGRLEKEKLTSGKVFKPLKSTHQRYRDVFSKLGVIAPPLISPQFDKVDISHLKIRSENKLIKIIGIAPFAAHVGKVYSIKKMEEVIKDLNSDFSLFLFGGGQKEEKILDKLASKYTNVINIANKYSLAQQMDIMSNLNIMVSMDSANGHIAALLGVNVLTIWGLTHPYAGFSPYGQKDNNNIIVKRSKFPKIPTSIYGNKIPPGYQNAIDSITSKEIILRIRESI